MGASYLESVWPEHSRWPCDCHILSPAGSSPLCGITMEPMECSRYKSRSSCICCPTTLSRNRMWHLLQSTQKYLENVRTSQVSQRSYSIYKALIRVHCPLNFISCGRQSLPFLFWDHMTALSPASQVSLANPNTVSRQLLLTSQERLFSWTEHWHSAWFRWASCGQMQANNTWMDATRREPRKQGGQSSKLYK